MSDEIIYSNGEVSQLLKTTIIHLRDMDFTTDRDAVSDTMDALRSISKGYRSMSKVFFEVKIKKCVRGSPEYLGKDGIEDYKKTRDELVRVLFDEKLDKMPLLINNPVTGHIAKFRLQVGR